MINLSNVERDKLEWQEPVEEREFQGQESLEEGCVDGLYPYDGPLEEPDHTMGAVGIHRRMTYSTAWDSYTGEWDEDSYPSKEISTLEDALEFLKDRRY